MTRSNHHSNPEKWELTGRIERLLDGTLDPGELADLQELLRNDPAAHAHAARLLHLHGQMRTAVPLLSGDARSSPGAVRKQPFRKITILPWAAAAAAAVAYFFFPSPQSRIQPAEKVVATLVAAKNCRWAESSLPTVQGSRIGPGHYELVEGIATFRFESGAEITLEAPATLDILDALNCRLRKGALMADVPPSAIGFTVDTPYSKVVDFGTKFGVSANEDGYYVVQVVEGLVEVTDKENKSTQALEEGNRISVGGLDLAEAEPGSEETRHFLRSSSVTLDDGWQRVSTAYARGADTFIQGGGWEGTPSALRDFGGHAILRVKRADEDPNTARKAYVRFDLGTMDLSGLQDSQLVFTIIPSDIGFASLVPDATFRVYGLTDEASDLWDENGISWQNAPAHLPSSQVQHRPDPAKSVEVGSFVIPQGKTSGTVSISGSALTGFLRADTNRLVTLILCRDTDESSKGGFVHEFASRENRSAQPPTLKLKLDP